MLTTSPQAIGPTSLELADVDPLSAEEIRTSVANFQRDFPRLAGHLTDIRPNAGLFIDHPHSYAATTPVDQFGSYAIELNPGYYGIGKRHKLTDATLGDYKANWHPYSQARGVFEHELAHVLDLELARVNDGYAPSFALELPDALSVSDYGLQAGPLETFADAFAAWRLGIPTGNANVRRLIDRVTESAR